MDIHRCSFHVPRWLLQAAPGRALAHNSTALPDKLPNPPRAICRQLFPVLANLERVNQRPSLDRNGILVPARHPQLHREGQFDLVARAPLALDPMKSTRLDSALLLSVDRDARTRCPLRNPQLERKVRGSIRS